jgi:site-specific DNA-methyltransferase (adenine-specific)/site-specific DNA-methyltransferase (cytosine-N4-specific)
MKQGVITWVDPNKLKENEVSKKLYSIPENYEMMKENISQFGILEPLIVTDNVVESGNLRLQIARELELEKIPVIYQAKKDIKAEILAVSHGQQRVKKYSEILAEYEILEAEYPVGKGCRTDLDPAKKNNADKKKALNISKAKLNQLKNIKVLAKELYCDNITEYNKVWANVDAEKSSINSVLKGLKRTKAILENEFVIPESFELISDKAKVYNKSCEDMNELADQSVSCIITSPPYFQMRDYGTGKEQRGLENDVDSYINGLITDFMDCKRVLKSEGSLWVNLTEAVVDGRYNAIPHRFVLEMIKEGWIFNDEWIWVKNNPNFTQAKRAVRSHEYIFHFVKSTSYHYDVSWLNEVTDPNDLISYGTTGKISNLMSSMDFRENIIRTNSNNMEKLRRDCKEKGFNLTHNAAFPINIPLIAILTSTKVGDTILDIYSGTSTTGEAALATKREYVGYEIKPEFVMASKVRLENYLIDEVAMAA